MHVGLDLDDVLADLIPELMRVHRQLTGQTLALEQVTDWQVFPQSVHDAVRHGGGYSRLAPKPGARAFINWLAGSGSPFSIITFRRPEAAAETFAWCEKHFGRVPCQVHFTGGSKLDTCRRLGIGLMVDDSLKHLLEVTGGLRIPGILMESPMNRGADPGQRIRRAADLTAARQILEAMAQK